MLRTTTTCTFSTAQLPKVLQEWCAFTILTSKRASCHNDVDISTSKSAPNLTQFFTVLNSKCASCHSDGHFSTAQLPKVHREWCAFTIFEFQMCFLPQRCPMSTFSTSQLPKALQIWQFFNSIDFEMCFLPQWRALFQQRNFRKCCKNGVPSPFWLSNVLPATTACTFSTSQSKRAPNLTVL
jgi:hypothetical protein